MGYKKRYSQDLGDLEHEFDPPPMPKFSNDELRTWGEWLQQFYEDKEVHKLDRSGQMETVRILNQNEAAVAFGAMSKKMHVGKWAYAIIVKPTDFGSNGQATKYETPTMYDRFRDKLEQYRDYMGRKEYAQKKGFEAYENMAEGVGNILPPDYGTVVEEL